jgi:tetratricopeptide (TPR) repeat protein
MKVKSIILGISLFIGGFTIAQDADECKRYQAIGGNAYKAKDYEKVVWAYNIAQKECGTLDMKFYNPYIYSAKMAMKNAASDKAKEVAYLDTLINIYETAQETHGIQPQWQSYLGYYYMKQAKEGFMSKADKAYSIGIHHDKQKANEGMVKQYYANLYNLWVQEQDDKKKDAFKERLINEFFKISDYLNKADSDGTTAEFMSTYMNKAVTDCASVLPSIRTFLDGLPQGIEPKKASVKNFMALLEDKSCTSSEEYAMLVDTIIKIDPSVDAVIARAKLYAAQGKTSEAIKTFKEALAMDEITAEQKSEVEYEIARTYYNAKNYKAAYGAGKNVSGKNSGKGYEIAANCVNAMMNECGVSTFDRKANNWYAVQLAEKSGNAKLVSAYKRQCPTGTDLFNQGISQGDKVKLECWGVSVSAVVYE